MQNMKCKMSSISIISKGGIFVIMLIEWYQNIDILWLPNGISIYKVAA